MNRLILLFCTILLLPQQGLPGGDASDGHSHGEETAPLTITNPNTPQRQPDGSVFLPKQTQRLIQVRTQAVKRQDLARSLVLNGQIIAGVDAHRKVHALQAGRLKMAPHHALAIGQPVEKGQVLAIITLANDAQEGTNQAVEAADLQAQLQLAQQDYQRLQQLGKVIAQREIDAAAATVRSLQARLAVFRKSVKGVMETVRAPIAGKITANLVTDGQAVQAGDLLLEIIDPSQWQVEAVTYDPALPANIATASVTIGLQTMTLHYQGNSQQLRQQALPLRFSIEGNTTLVGLVAGLLVQVTVQTRDRSQGMAVPISALVRNPSNQTVVWVKRSPEHYAPRIVHYQPLDGERVLVTAGLQDGERVVVQATHLINQIR